jgi:hypothetical protein
LNKNKKQLTNLARRFPDFPVNLNKKEHFSIFFGVQIIFLFPVETGGMQ